MGSRSVGKSSLVIQFVQGQFVDSYDPTIENTFNKTMKVHGQEYEVLVVDTAGQDEYSIFPTQVLALGVLSFEYLTFFDPVQR